MRIWINGEWHDSESVSFVLTYREDERKWLHEYTREAPEPGVPMFFGAGPTDQVVSLQSVINEIEADHDTK